MDKVIIKIPGAPDREIELAPGPHKVGRSVNTDLQIDHPSVSSAHCELTARGGTITARDLGSTNGLSLDGQRVQECEFTPGQSLRVGEAEITYGVAAPQIPAPVPSQFVPRLIVPKARRPRKKFYRSLPGTLLYPLQKHGFVFMITGIVVFGLFDFLLNFHSTGLVAIATLFGSVPEAFAIGFMFTQIEAIIRSSVEGDDYLPSWPEFDGWWESCAGPYFRLLGIFAASALPAIICFLYLGSVGLKLLVPSLIFAGFYAPMAVLVVAVEDSIAAVNPLLVLPSISNVAPAYLTMCASISAGFYGLSQLTQWINRLFTPPPPPFRLPVVGRTFSAQFMCGHLIDICLWLYFALLVARVLGLLYHTHKERLVWRR
jgi:hypothetical protein